jgi:hypothetical protein
MASTPSLRAVLARWLDSPQAAAWASVASLVIGLFFAFVRAPHPWGWEGIDQYHELAQSLARGEPFATTDVPWGYAYFVAFFYALVGPHAWLPVLAQVIANATVPLLLFRLVRPVADVRVASMAAWLAGIFSFNTIYASTLASDAICTVLFLAALVCFGRGTRTDRLRDFAWSGLLFGVVPQFRPNLILLPALIAAVYVLARRWSWRAVVQMTAFVALVGVALTPWIVRNYGLTGRLLPTSTHGGIQLWYGSLQVGPYLESRAYNPRSAFEAAAFDYTSLAGDAIVVSARSGSCATPDTSIELVYWTDRDMTPRRLTASPGEAGRIRADVPGQLDQTVLYYYFEAARPAAAGRTAATLRTPLDGDTNPFVYFVSTDHLGDLDRRGDLLDVFDLVRVLRHVAWGDALADAARMDLDGDAAVDQDDVRLVVVRLLGDGATLELVKAADALRWDDRRLVLTIADGSTLTVDRARSARVTDLDVRGTLASTLVYSRRPWRAHTATVPAGAESCELVEDVRVNDVFYRREVHMMGRYFALAYDNIARDPVAFAKASAYRMGRLFVLRGASDTSTAHQFAGSGVIYTAGLVLSIGYLLLFVAGLAVAFARRSALRVLLLPIVYVPLTICFVLTNMRYTITVQPLMFAFVAMAVVAAFRLDKAGPSEGRLPR